MSETTLHTTATLHTTDGLRLEARWDEVPDSRLCLVFLHPHPLHGGTMTAPLMSAVTKRLTDAGFAVLRFNYRGVGASEGTYGGGTAEIIDIDAAFEEAASSHPDLPRRLAGWSFGAIVGLGWQAARQSSLPYAGIAPALTSDLSPAVPEPGELVPAPRTFIIGDHDQFTSVEDLERYAGTIGADVEVIRGSDHFFYFREDRVGRILAGALR